MEYFNYAIQPYSKNPIFQLNKHIGYCNDDGYGIDGYRFSKELFEVASYKPDKITIYVNSLGGDVQQGFEILTAIADVDCETEVIINGFAYSTAGWCCLSATCVKMYGYASAMTHAPKNVEKNDDGAKVVTDTKNNFISTIYDSIVGILINSSGRNGAEKKTKEEVEKMLDTETIYTPKQFLDMGFIDEIIETSSKEKPLYEVESKEVKNEYKKQQAAVNKFLEDKKSTGMKLLQAINHYKLNADANVETVLQHLHDMNQKLSTDFAAENKAKTDLTAERDKLQLDLKSATEAQNKLQAEYDALKGSGNVSEDLKKLNAELKVSQEAQNKLASELKEANDKLATEAAERTKAELGLKTERADKLIAKYAAVNKVPALPADYNEETATDEQKEAYRINRKWHTMAVNDYDTTEAMLAVQATNIKLPTVTDKFDANGPDFGDFSHDTFRAINKQNREGKK